MDVKDAIIQIEEVLAADTLPAPPAPPAPPVIGYQIGKALRAAVNSKDNEALALLQEIQTVLKEETLPENATEIAKLLRNLQLIAKDQADEAALDPKVKSFLEYANSASTAYASGVNAINIFGSALAYQIGDHSPKIKEHRRILGTLVALTMVFLPLSLLTLGLSHSLKYRLKWMRLVAIMLMMETMYMMMMCSLFGIYLINGARERDVLGCVFAAGSPLLVVPLIVFRLPVDPMPLWNWIKAGAVGIFEGAGGIIAPAAGIPAAP